jgi:bifunctional non-homologous end joining protein LigD
MMSRQKPAFVVPAPPTLVAESPGGGEWLHEVKHDGYRTISVVEDGRARIFTRRGHDYTARMSGIVEALAGLPYRSAVIDGEAVIRDEDGMSDFFALNAALARHDAPEAQLVAFDLPYLDGENLRDRPIEERRAKLAELLDGAGLPIQFSHEVAGDGPKVLRAAREHGLEGIVSKRRCSPYRSDRVKTWVMPVRDSFAVIGADGSPARALRLARLVSCFCCGWAGSGLATQAGRNIRTAALRVRRPAPDRAASVIGTGAVCPSLTG